MSAINIEVVEQALTKFAQQTQKSQDIHRVQGKKEEFVLFMMKQILVQIRIHPEKKGIRFHCPTWCEEFLVSSLFEQFLQAPLIRVSWVTFQSDLSFSIDVSWSDHEELVRRIHYRLSECVCV